MCFYTVEEVTHAKKLIFQLLDGAEPKVSDPPRCVTHRRTSAIWNVKIF